MTFRASLVPGNGQSAVMLGSVPIVVLGLLMATLTVVSSPWPPDPAAYGQTVSFSERLRGKEVGFYGNDDAYKTSAWYARRVFDGMALGLLVLAYACTAAVVLLRVRWAIVMLVSGSLIGLLYSGSVGLDFGPMLMAGGFSLVLFGAGLSLAQTGTGFERR